MANSVRSPIPSKFKLLAASVAISLFHATRTVKRGAHSLLLVLGHTLSPMGGLLLKLIVLPLYRLGVLLRLRINHLALPVRGVMLFFITNRYLLHVTTGILALSIIGNNLQSRQAHAQDVGQKSLLFVLATDQRTEIIEEEIRYDTMGKNTKYLGASTLVGIPHIDFDYDETVDAVIPSRSVPGTIAAQPMAAPSPGPATPRTNTETYVVQEHDTISSIADRMGVNVGSILWNNHLTARQYIRPGDTLRIPAVSGILIKIKSGDSLSKLAKRYNGDEQEIANFNGLSLDQRLALGTELLIPGGQPPQIEETRTRILARGSEERLAAPTPVPKPADAELGDLPSTRMLWPTPSRTITQYYGWRHTGVDIDGDFSSPIYASADGLVEKAGWNSGGYGLMLLLSHPNGMLTRYGHASKLFVKTGDTVKRGQVIAMVGTTGRSTGTHLHYEIYLNDSRVNPLAFTR